LAVVVVALCALAGCSGEPKQDAAPADALIPDPHGRWMVTAHHIPGVGAMSDEAATAWYGRTFDIETGRAIFDGDTCRAASYGNGQRNAARFLGEYYHIAPFTLGIQDTAITLTWVSCDGAFWEHAGATLIWVGPDRTLTPWDGVFFELTRVREE
jgi:hypothetical protein